MIGITGYLCLDLFPKILNSDFEFTPGLLLETGPLTARAAGVVGNTGGVIARLGVSAKIRGVVGEDMFGAAVRNAFQPLLHDNQILELFTLPQGATASTVVLNPPNRDRMFLVNRGSNGDVTSRDFGPAFRKGLSIFHFGYPPLCEAMTLQNGLETKRIFQACQQEGILTSLDMCVPSPGSFAYELDWVAYLREVLPCTDMFCPSIDEIRFMLKMPTQPPEELATALLNLGAKAVFLKMGADGLMIRTADTDAVGKTYRRFGDRPWRNVSHIVPPRPVKVYGTTGAGDSAIAGLLAAIRRGAGAAEAAEFGAMTAETVISSPLGMDAITPALLADKR